jgi:hypothetical protein
MIRFPVRLREYYSERVGRGLYGRQDCDGSVGDQSVHPHPLGEILQAYASRSLYH